MEALPLDPPGGSPMLSPDAKVLHWRALLDNEWHVIRAARDDVTLPFPPGTSTWPASDFAADYPAFVAGTQELFFAGLGDIYVMPRDGDVWGVPADGQLRNRDAVESQGDHHASRSVSTPMTQQ